MLTAENLEGKVVGRYKIEKLFGEGGMAFVYKGIHSDLGLPIAFKVLFSEFAKNPEVRERFKREARLQFKLQHPNLVRVIDLIEEDGLLGMVMDWIEGRDLAKFLDEHPHPMSLNDIRRIFLPVLSAVGHAHEKHIIHRDLKPANILLEGNPGEEIPKVMDFGIAKSLDDDASKTKTGLVVGTPYYLAPEQARGSKDIDHRADIYSLGVTLYQMLTGRLPYDGETAIQIITAHCMAPFPAISNFLPHIDPHLEQVVSKAMAKAPEDRFQSCQEFADALDVLLPQKTSSTAQYRSWSGEPSSLKRSSDSTTVDKTSLSADDYLATNLDTPSPASIKTTVDKEPQAKFVIRTSSAEADDSSNIVDDYSLTTEGTMAISASKLRTPLPAAPPLSAARNESDFDDESIEEQLEDPTEEKIISLIEDDDESSHSKKIIYLLAVFVIFLLGAVAFLLFFNKSHPQQNQKIATQNAKKSTNTLKKNQKIATQNAKKSTNTLKKNQMTSPSVRRPDPRRTPVPLTSPRRKVALAHKNHATSARKRKTSPHTSALVKKKLRKHKRKSRRASNTAWSSASYRRCFQCVSKNFRRINTSALPGMNRYSGVCNYGDFLSVARNCSRRCSRNYLYYCVAYLQQPFQAGLSYQRYKAGTIKMCRAFAVRFVRTKKLKFFYPHISSTLLRRCARNWRRLHRR